MSDSRRNSFREDNVHHIPEKGRKNNKSYLYQEDEEEVDLKPFWEEDVSDSSEDKS